MARPRKASAVRHYAIGALHLYEGEDDDMIAFFESLPPRKRRAGLKAALRAGGMQTVRVEDLSDDEELEDAAAAFLK
jgi:hypothetical protein